MRGVNKVILVGNLGHDVEVRQMTNGNPVANIRIATNERWTRRDTGQVQEHTEWHNVVLFGRRAELAQQYLHKGSRIYVEGRLRTRSWQDREGQERRSTEVVADDMQFLDRRGGDGDYDQRRSSQPSGYLDIIKWVFRRNFEEGATESGLFPRGTCGGRSRS